MQSVTSNAVATQCLYNVFSGVSNLNETKLYTLQKGHYQLSAYYFGGLAYLGIITVDQHGQNGTFLDAIFANQVFSAYSILIENNYTLKMTATTADAVTFVLCKEP